jgi:hypothetical protein
MTRPLALRPTDPNRVLGVEEVRSVLGCAAATAARLIDKGLIPGWRLPSADNREPSPSSAAQPRRVLLRDLLDFLRDRGLPSEMMAGIATRFVLCACPPCYAPWLADDSRGVLVDDAPTLLAAGLVIGRYGAEAFVVGAGVPRVDALSVPPSLAGARGRPSLIALVPEDCPETGPYTSAGYDAVLPSHAPPELVWDTFIRLRTAKTLRRTNALRGITP